MPVTPSIRRTLIGGILAGIGILLGAASLVSYLLVKRVLYTQFDRQMEDRANALIAMVKTQQGIVEFDWLDRDEDHPAGHIEGAEWYTISLDDGRPLVASDDAGALPSPTAAPGSSSLIRQVQIPDGTPGRQIDVRFLATVDPEIDPDDDPDEERTPPEFQVDEPARMRLSLARPDPVHPTLVSLKGVFAALWLGGSFLAASIIGVAVRRGLSPIDDLKRQISELDGTERDQKISLSREPEELSPVVAELNSLLERLDQSLVRERRVNSNIAHELRTPVAGLLSTLEVLLGRERSSTEYEAACQTSFEIAQRMHWLVTNLLSLTRLDSNHIHLENRELTLPDTLVGWWQPFSKTAEKKRLQITWSIDPDTSVTTDPEYLKIAITNLFDNAVSYTEAAGRISIDTSEGSRISVKNSTAALPRGLAENASEPFWRGTGENQGSENHTGLGLALAERVVSLLGAKLSLIVNEREQSFEAVIAFPPCPQTRTPEDSATHGARRLVTRDPNRS